MAAVVGVLLVAGAVTAYATTRTPAPTYRTTTVSTQSVRQVLLTTGTIEPGASASVTFPVSGTVASVRAVLGGRVTKGEQLAALDATALRTAVASATATVAHARLTLHQAETAQTSTSTASGSGTSGGSGTGGPSSGTGGGTSAKIAAAQRQLVGSVHQADQLLATTTSDLALATTLCPAPTTPGTAHGTASADSAAALPTATKQPTASTASTTGTSAPKAGPGPGPVPTTCAEAQQLVLNDETRILALQQGISTQEAALDRLLVAAAKTSSGSPTGTTKSSTGSSSSRTTSSTTTTVSAAQLAADQASVDAAVAALAVADQNLAQAVLVAPMSGVVSSVGVTVGQSVSAGSSSSAIDVIDPDAHSVTLSIDVTKIPLVKVGQHAEVVPDGSSTPLAATVAYVAAAPSTSGGSSYLVRLAFAGSPTGLRDGIQAGVTLTVAQATGLAVPTSAVHHLGPLAYVTLLAKGAQTRQVVTVGAVGTVYTQVSRGLTAGQVVVLADVDAAIPTSTVTSRIARFAGAGGLGGAGALGGLGGTGTGGGTGRTRG